MLNRLGVSYYRIYFKRSDLPYDDTKDAGEKSREDYIRDLAKLCTAYIDPDCNDFEAVVLIPHFSRYKKVIRKIFRELVNHACYIYSFDDGGLLWEKQSDAAHTRNWRELERKIKAEEVQTA